MCYPVTCPKCGKTGWGGCGQHVDSVMKSVPAAERCACDQDSAPETSPGIFGSLFGR
ncbi:hypothetical protein Q3O43_25585 [Rhodococcus aetherivorans]|uniref:hypothetical protein n=1 Tax=Rhodococcus aetherivorans TaxID=191292 RepID=UPI0026EDCD44|nr:hypothetical protein [Rhodococcus aetherivorans]WKW98340.1 hypothetical protein Q3O43_25585 [Rhodococcus aetherivorans]